MIGGRLRRMLSKGRGRSFWPLMEQGAYRSYRSVHPFDERFGVETSGLIYDLETGHAHDACNNGYFAVAPSLFHQVMERLELDYPRFGFVDLGSGKGRALLLASDYPFRAVIGVELSAELHRIAQVNIAQYLKRASKGSALTSPRSFQADATEFIFPPGPLVVYMWNAFAEPVMDRVLLNLRASLLAEPREIYLVYVHPELEKLLESFPWLERMWIAEIEMSDEDYAAWAFPPRTEVCAVYRANTWCSSL